jgi:hypothetical protein
MPSLRDPTTYPTIKFEALKLVPGGAVIPMSFWRDTTLLTAPSRASDGKFLSIEEQVYFVRRLVGELRRHWKAKRLAAQGECSAAMAARSVI